jgi:glycosyltransferase involved in cell wall biosynthesis
LAIPVYNGERYLAAAIDSLLAQTFTDFELIITDNASTDATQDICSDYARRDPRIRYIRNKRNLGAAGNFNLGFARASGKYFKWCAHDDFISPNYLEQAVRCLEARPEAVVAFGRLQGVDSEGVLTRYVERGLPGFSQMSPARRFRTLLDAHGLDGAIFGVYQRKMLARTSLHAPYYGSDCALLAELALLGDFAMVPEITLYNRDHPRRSVNIHSRERLAWQNPNAAGKNPFELTNRIRHLFAIAYRHRASVPLYKSMPQLIAWAANPLLVGRCTLEFVGALSPSLRTKLRAVGLGVIGWISPKQNTRSARSSDALAREKSAIPRRAPPTGASQ